MTNAHGRKLPLARNVYWGQVLYGALLGALGAGLIRHYTGAATLSAGGVLARWIALGVATVAFLVYLQNLYRHGLVPDYSLKCRFCMGPVNRYSEFCEHCGADLIAEEKLMQCASCGVDLYEGTKHCPECGASTSARSGKSKRKKGKGKGKREAPSEDTAQVGWSTPVDALSGFPPENDR